MLRLCNGLIFSVVYVSPKERTGVSHLNGDASYALRVMLKRSDKGSEIKAVIPPTETEESAGDASNQE